MKIYTVYRYTVYANLYLYTLCTIYQNLVAMFKRYLGSSFRGNIQKHKMREN